MAMRPATYFMQLKLVYRIAKPKMVNSHVWETTLYRLGWIADRGFIQWGICLTRRRNFFAGFSLVLAATGTVQNLRL